MKKIVLVGVLMGLGLAAVGCDNKKKAATPPPAQAETLTPPPAYIPPQSSAPVDTGTTVVTPAPERIEPPAKQAPHRSKPAAEPASISAGSTYTVRKGDSLSEIAKRVYGSASKKNVDRIKKANNLKGDTIRVGQKLKIPGASSGTGRAGSTGNK